MANFPHFVCTNWVSCRTYLRRSISFRATQELYGFCFGDFVIALTTPRTEHGEVTIKKFADGTERFAGRFAYYYVHDTPRQRLTNHGQLFVYQRSISWHRHSHSPGSGVGTKPTACFLCRFEKRRVSEKFLRWQKGLINGQGTEAVTVYGCSSTLTINVFFLSFLKTILVKNTL